MQPQSIMHFPLKSAQFSKSKPRLSEANISDWKSADQCEERSALEKKITSWLKRSQRSWRQPKKIYHWSAHVQCAVCMTKYLAWKITWLRCTFNVLYKCFVV
mmetsp:Transcript_46069/g.122188  ORF Transcript_46069/g.122188 Transcript_46069/m.122188 type:complete len:102 (+) Transcript_46069:129-434(+)